MGMLFAYVAFMVHKMHFIQSLVLFYTKRPNKTL